jgi:hypothetical protein
LLPVPKFKVPVVPVSYVKAPEVKASPESTTADTANNFLAIVVFINFLIASLFK